MNKKPLLIAIVGPTASGKSDLAMECAAAFDGEIVSADSRQVYRYLDIGTAKPTQEQRARIPHHFIDILDPSEMYNAGRFGSEARAVIDTIVTRGKSPILVGGSGLYVRSVIDGMFEGPGSHANIRERLERLFREKGEEALRKELQAVDPESAGSIERGKPRRLIRALEVFLTTGRTISSHHREKHAGLGLPVIQFALRWERADLNARIELRARAMFAHGLLPEVEKILARGFKPSLNALNTVGYKEAIACLQGRQTVEEALVSVVTNTRRFAKRQMTWFRADHRIQWIDAVEPLDLKQVMARVLRMVNSRRAD